MADFNWMEFFPNSFCYIQLRLPLHTVSFLMATPQWFPVISFQRFPFLN